MGYLIGAALGIALVFLYDIKKALEKGNEQRERRPSRHDIDHSA
jgi:hypothetical protein